MGYKCIRCERNEVSTPGGICPSCMAANDPFAQSASMNGGGQGSSKGGGFEWETYGGNGSSVPTPGAGQPSGGYQSHHGGSYGYTPVSSEYPVPGPSVPAFGSGRREPALVREPYPLVDRFGRRRSRDSYGDYDREDSDGKQKEGKSAPATRGFVKNVREDREYSGTLFKWFRAFFTGTPYCREDDITAFQVVPDFSGTSSNESGNIGDQVLMHGFLIRGTISENNEVEVYGRRDRFNNIIAKSVFNVATGTSVRTGGTLSAIYVRIITLLLIGGVIGTVRYFGIRNLQQYAVEVIVGSLALIILWVVIKLLFLRRS